MPLKYTVFQLRTGLFVKAMTGDVVRNNGTVYVGSAHVVENRHSHNWRPAYNLKFEEKEICVEWQED